MNPTPTADLPVLIVGAGPTGLTAALELSRLGVAIRIVDKATEPSSTSRALGIQARTIELLRVRGVGADLVRLGNRATSTALYARGKRLAGIELDRVPSEFNYVLLLAQSETERLLTEQLDRQGVQVERGVELTSLTPGDGSAVSAVLRGADGSQVLVRSQYVIAADGSHSVVRKTLGLPFAGRSLPHSYVLGDVRVAGAVPQDQLSIFLGRRGFLAAFPMGGGRFRFMATDPDGLTGDDDAPALTDIQRLYDRAAHIPARLHDLQWTSRFRINSRHMTRLRSGRVFFGGDAAHVHSPAGGQGMNAGIQDMINLSWKLAMVLDGRAHPALLDTYESDRLPVIRQLVRMTERATTVFNSTNPVVHGALTRLAPALLGRSRVQDAAASRLGQISAGYRGCPSALGGGRIGTLVAGDRVPDIELTLATGERGKLYDLLDLATPTLVVTGDDQRIVTAWRPWRDVVPLRWVCRSDSAGGDGSAWILVRPDGYLAAAGGPADGPTLSRWLHRWLITAAADRAVGATRDGGRPSGATAALTDRRY